MSSLSRLAKSSAVALLCLAAFAASAQTAPSKLYGEIGYTLLDYKESGYSADPGILRAVIGAEVHPNVNLEGMVGMGITDGSTRVGSITVKSEVDQFWGFYVKPKVALTPDIELFGRLGFASSKISASVPGFSLSDSGSSVSYGIGMNFKVSQSTSLNADYMSYYSKDGVKANGFTVGLGLKF